MESILALFVLVQRRERREREVILTRELLEQIDYLNQFLPPDCQIEYIHRDMAKINKRLVTKVNHCLKKDYPDSVHKNTELSRNESF